MINAEPIANEFALTDDFIKKIVSEVESGQNLLRKRRAWNSELIRTGKLRLFVEMKMKEMYPKTYTMYTVTDYSILNKIVNKKAKSYKQSPIRKVMNAQAASEIYQQIVDNFCLNHAMSELDISYNQHKHGLVAAFMDRESTLDGSTKLFWKFYSMAPYEYDVIKDADGKVKVVILSYPSQTIVGNSGGDGINSLIAEAGGSDEANRERIYTLWTDTEHKQIKVRGEKGTDNMLIDFLPIEGNEAGINPYGILPFVYVPLDFDKNYPNPSPLPLQTVELNALLSVYLTSANMQVGVLRISRPEKQKVSINSHSLYTAIEAPQSSDPEDKPTTIDFISPTPNMSGHKEAITTYLSTILDEQGIGSNQIINPTDKYASGFDRLLAQADVQDIIEENQELYGKVEQQIYKIVAHQLKTQGQGSLPDEGFQIIYKKPRVMITDKEKLENLALMKNLGLWPDWELIQQYDPNLTEDEAKAKLKEISAARSKAAQDIINPPADPNQPAPPKA